MGKILWYECRPPKRSAPEGLTNNVVFYPEDPTFFIDYVIIKNIHPMDPIYKVSFESEGHHYDTFVGEDCIDEMARAAFQESFVDLWLRKGTLLAALESLVDKEFSGVFEDDKFHSFTFTEDL